MRPNGAQPPSRHNNVDMLSREAKERARGQAFWRLCELYKFGRSQQAILLNRSPNNRAVLKSLEESHSFPDDELARLNLSQLLGIHKNLSILYPHSEEDESNRRLKYAWFHVRREAFDGLSALDFIMAKAGEVFSRLTIVRRFLDIRRTSF